MIFLTVGVIAVTLIGQGLTLAPLIRWLGLAADDSSAREEQLARLAAALAALDRLDDLAGRSAASTHAVQDLRRQYAARVEQLDGAAAGADGAVAGLRELRAELIAAERRALIDLRNRNQISDGVLRRIQRELDLEQVRLEAGGR